MPNGLIIYSTTDGHTKAISGYIRDNIIKNKHFELVSLKEATYLNLNDFDNIIIGASIRYGKHQKELYKFIDNNILLLNNTYSSFFSVNVVARKINKNSVNTNPYMQSFLKMSNWRPDNVAVFAGKIDYQKYKFVDKHMIRLIMWLTKGPTDITKIYEFTNWKDVDDFITILSKNNK